MSLAESLESAAEALPGDAEQIRPANGDPFQLLTILDSDAGRRILAWLLFHHPEDGEELASAWLEEEAGAALVVAVPQDDLPKEGRKALRRLVHQARSRGVVIADSAEQAPHVGRLPDLDEKISKAYVSAYDPRGGRLVYIVESNPSGGARIFEALLDVERGIVDFQVYRAGRRQVGEFVRDLEKRPRFAAVEAAPESVRALIARRLAGQSAERSLPKAFSEWRGKLSLADEATTTPGERVRVELADPGEALATPGLVEEVEQGSIGPWPPQPEVLERVALALREEFAPLGRDPSILEARVDEEVSSLYLAGETARANAERFEETAYLYLHDGKEGLARACLGTADELRSEGGERGPVLQALMSGVTGALTRDLEKRLGWTDESSGPEDAD